jgi:hypothetical protein
MDKLSSLLPFRFDRSVVAVGGVVAAVVVSGVVVFKLRSRVR